MRDLINRGDRNGHRAVRGLLFSLVALVCQGTVYGADSDEPPQYDVEVVIFRNLYPQTDGELRSGYTPDAATEFASAPLQSDLVELSGKLHTLDNVAGALRRSGAYRVLAHRAWRQSAYDRSNTVPYRLQADPRNTQYSVQGTIRLIRERFLHLDVDLALRQDQGNGESGTGELAAGPVSHLDETRRVRNNELHYFDNPWFGMIAKVTPYNRPESPGVASGENPETADQPATTGAGQLPATDSGSP